VVAANSELQERGLLKHARITKSITAALRERGTDELTARLGAETGMLAFSVAFERWMEANDGEPFPPFADAALSDLRARAAELVLPSRLAGRGRLRDLTAVERAGFPVDLPAPGRPALGDTSPARPEASPQT
jgi:hypothetical protein